MPWKLCTWRDGLPRKTDPVWTVSKGGSKSSRICSVKDVAVFSTGFLYQMRSCFWKIFFNEVLVHRIHAELLHHPYFRTKADSVYITLGGMEEKLPATRFMKVHKSYIVNLEKVTALDGNDLFVGKAQIPVKQKSERRGNGSGLWAVIYLNGNHYLAGGFNLLMLFRILSGIALLLLIVPVALHRPLKKILLLL